MQTRYFSPNILIPNLLERHLATVFLLLWVGTSKLPESDTFAKELWNFGFGVEKQSKAIKWNISNISSQTDLTDFLGNWGFLLCDGIRNVDRTWLWINSRSFEMLTFVGDFIVKFFDRSFTFSTEFSYNFSTFFTL